VTPAPDRGAKVLLGLAAVAVGFAAADNYVVVLALPDMMGSAGLSAEDLQQAAPIISGFLLGYIAILPLIGRLSDVRGRLPVLVGSLVVFGLGSVVTAAAYDLPSVVAGRVVQGVGAGGLLPATLALVADVYPPRRRGLPLGVVGAVQELGNVAGPVYGAVVLAFAGWRTIFWINLAVALVRAAVIRLHRQTYAAEQAGSRRFDVPGALLALVALGGAVLVMIQPARVLEDVTWGLLLLPVAGEGRWLSPVALSATVCLVLLVIRCAVARDPLLDVRGWGRTLARIDLVGALLLAVALAGVILAFATADPQAELLAPSGAWLLALTGVAALSFWRRNRRVAHPLVPPGAVTARPAWGALAVSFFVGVAVIAALVDIPIFARLTVHNDSQLLAAFVLLRFLVGLPVGAFLGGWLTRRLDAGVVTALGMVVSAAGFVWMSRWPFEALEHAWATIPLVAAGLGVGLAMAPVNAALLAATEPSAHGLVSALLIVSRTVGKLVGISVLTTVGLHRYYAAQEGLPEPMEVCGAGDSRCAEFSRLLQDAALTQLHTTFLGAAISCVLAGVLALVVLRGADTREIRTSAFQAGVG
jgi:MFS family permease